jgi:hypothetical protein
MKVFFFAVLVSLSGFIAAQKITPEVIGSAGDVFKSGGFTLEWTLGEIATESLTSTNFKLTQGFHQGRIVISSVSNPVLEGFNVYPNPVQASLSLENFTNGMVDYILTDIQGLKVVQNKITEGVHLLNTENIPAGIYILKVQNQNQSQYFKIEKLNK